MSKTQVDPTIASGVRDEGGCLRRFGSLSPVTSIQSVHELILAHGDAVF
uniref:Uncharacterized protein n=1 Tax=Arundo donax TaxID=35708 RepID=A0A0A9HF71_ARUDO